MRKLPFILLLLLAGCGTTDGPPMEDVPLEEEGTITAYTTRLPGSNPEEQALILTQTVYPATREDNTVGAIILTPQNKHIAFTAMQRVTHMPVNAPLLYLDEENRISPETLLEMSRLQPDGVMQDQRTQVYAINVPPTQVDLIEEELDYKVRTFYEEDPVKLAEILDRWQAAMKADHPDVVVISAVDHPKGLEYGLGQMGWNAHKGGGFAWVYQDSIPTETIEILERRCCGHGNFIYLTGPPEVISDRVAKELGQWGLVFRMGGENVYEASKINAGYKDYGRNFGWWWGWTPRKFGWGIAQAGHNFIIGNPKDALMMIPAAVLGHMGKHGPMLLVTEDSIPKSVRAYLEMVKPFPTGPQETILNFGWIIGDETYVSRDVQMEADRLLSPFPLLPRQEPVIPAQRTQPEADTVQTRVQ